MNIYKRLRDLREDNDKTQNDIALLLDISQQHYALYETGKRELPMHHFMTLAKYYNVSLDYLSGLVSTPIALYQSEPLSAASSTYAGNEDRKLLQAFHNAPHNVKVGIYDLLNLNQPNPSNPINKSLCF